MEFITYKCWRELINFQKIYNKNVLVWLIRLPTIFERRRTSFGRNQLDEDVMIELRPKEMLDFMNKTTSGVEMRLFP